MGKNNRKNDQNIIKRLIKKVVVTSHNNRYTLDIFSFIGQLVPIDNCVGYTGSGGRGRTDMRLLSRDFESRASAISPHRHIDKSIYKNKNAP